MDAMQSKYTITEDWTGKHFLGLTLDWNHEAGNVTLSMPDYIPTELHHFKHPVNCPPKYTPSKFISPIYGKKFQYIKEDNNSPILLPSEIKQTQSVVGTLMYYGLALENKMLVHLGDLASAPKKVRRKQLKR